jgi:DNA-binding winged helix-turn-helix (wHTH) protein/predicted ATPase
VKPAGGHFVFPPFRLDPLQERVWRDTAILPLRPKLFAILHYLVEHPARLVTRDELLRAIWPGTAISEGVLRGCVRALREVLEDDADTPRFIETVPRRGYRFIAPLGPDGGQASSMVLPATAAYPRRSPVVGRERELAQLRMLFEKARRGDRQVVFVTGEPGIGKTTLATEFLASLADEPHLWVGQGQCVEQYGAGEAYLPLLEAFGRMAREVGGQPLVTVLRRYAPSWLAQMPAVLGVDELETLCRGVVGTTRERMLREMIETIEVLTAAAVMVLVLEDLHWADHCTLDWLSAIGKQRGAARLLVLGTYRPAEVSLHAHPLKAVKQELHGHGHCEELWLPFLTSEHVVRYLSARFPGHRFPATLAGVIHHRTDGNPLFVVNVLDYLLAQGVIVEVEGGWRFQGGVDVVDRRVPEGLRELIEKHIERLDDNDRRMLEVASVAGTVFSAATVATAATTTVEAVEECSEALARHGQFVRAHEPEALGDGRMAGRYEFLHGLYQTVLYERLPLTQRIRLHRRIGEIEEARHGERAAEIAAELAMHFERGNDPERAATYHWEAAQIAMRAHAYHEAVTHLMTVLGLLQRLPDTSERTRRELTLQVNLGAVLTMTKGYAAGEVERCFARARVLLSQSDDSSSAGFAALLGLWMFHLVRAEHELAHTLAQELLRLAESSASQTALAYAHMANGASDFWLGRLEAARGSLESAVELCASLDPGGDSFVQSTHPGVVALSYSAVAFWMLGYPDQALDRAHTAVRLARDLQHPHNLAVALFFSCWVHQARGEEHVVEEQAREMTALATEHGFPIWAAAGEALQGWVEARQTASAVALHRIEGGIADHQATGAAVDQPHLRQLLVEACGATGDAGRGLAAVDEALSRVAQTHERVCEAELCRLKGELALRSAPIRRRAGGQRRPPAARAQQAEAERCFRQAVEIARQQGARSLELRATMSWCRLLEASGRPTEGRQALTAILRWFTEGRATVDLKEAASLLPKRP